MTQYQSEQNFSQEENSLCLKKVRMVPTQHGLCVSVEQESRGVALPASAKRGQLGCRACRVAVRDLLPARRTRNSQARIRLDHEGGGDEPWHRGEGSGRVRARGLP